MMKTADNIAEALAQLEKFEVDDWSGSSTSFGPCDIAALAIMGSDPARLRIILESFDGPVPTAVIYRRWRGVVEAMR
jgi:hypothetical protein